MQQINNIFSQEVNHNHYYKMPEKFRLPFQLFCILVPPNSGNRINLFQTMVSYFQTILLDL